MSFLRKGILVTAGQMIGILMGVLSGMLYSRVLGPDGVGQYRLFNTTLVVVATIGVMGISSAGIYFLNNRKIAIERLTTNGVRFALVTGGTIAAIMTTVFLCLPGYFGRISVPVAVFFAMAIGVMPLWAVLYQLLVAQLAARRMVTLQFLRSTVVLVGGALLAVFGWLTTQSGIVIFALGAFGATALVLFYQRKNIDLSIPFDWALFREVLSYGVKIASADIMLLVMLEMSVILLRYLMPGSFEPIGFYSRATTICGLIVIVPRTLGPLLFAKWSGVTGRARLLQVEMAMRMSLTYSLLMAVGVILLGKYAIWMMYGKEFLPAMEALRILAFSTVSLSVFTVCYNVLAGDGRANLMAWVLAASIAILVVVTWWLVPIWGISGAAVGALCASACTAVCGVAICMKLYGLNPLRCLFVCRSDLQYIRQAFKSRGQSSQGDLNTDEI